MCVGMLEWFLGAAVCKEECLKSHSLTPVQPSVKLKPHSHFKTQLVCFGFYLHVTFI